MCSSNFDYCVLGREIERVSGESYEAYVKEHVLKPIGITEMRLGKTLKKDAVAGEVSYYMAKPNLAMAVYMGRWARGCQSLTADVASRRWIRTARGSPRRRTW